jgi:hypothetical protein
MKFSWILFFLVFSCASHKTYNQTTLGRVIFQGGVYEKETWDQPLVFKRMSWYHGMTLYFDALLWKVDVDSPFAKWFSSSEKEFFTKCESLLVTAGYSADPLKISHVSFREQMKLNGYDDVVINNFASYLKSHPSAQDWRLVNYKIMGYCKRSPSKVGTGRKLAINFPSFQQLEVDL